MRPCPFCGSDNISVQHLYKNDCKIYEAYCVVCWGNRGWYDSKEDAITKWNERSCECRK